MPPALDGSADASGWTRLAGVVLPVTIVGAILVFIVPVPPAVLDLLQSANITLAVLVLLTTLAIRSPTDFSEDRRRRQRAHPDVRRRRDRP